MDINENLSLKDLLSEINVNELLSELEEETPILRKKPSDICKRLDIDARKKELLKLEWLNDLYVLPLVELANRINIKLCNRTVKFLGLENLSIMGRTMKVRDYLFEKGCTIDMIRQVIPKSEREINILLSAKARGFDLGFEENQSLDNSDRLLRAQEYLDSFSNKKSDYGRTR